jgi:hypothetical protein
MSTTTEKRITERRRAKGVLIPILEDIFESMVEVEDEDDIGFMNDLMRARMRERQKGVFSPSMLSSCMRQAYFVKTGQEKRPALAPGTNAIFLDGDFRHYKWQFALWKAHQAKKLTLLGVEVRVHSESGDFVGTIDAIVSIGGRIYIVDFKGMNVRSFMEFVNKGITLGHGIQITGYGMIYAKTPFLKKELEGCLLIGESKGGVIQGVSPLALHEEFVPIRRFKSKVKKRLAALRRHVEEEDIPSPACVSTRHKEFQECPFSWYCREEVKVIQKERERAARSNPRKLSVSKPSRGKHPGDRKTSLHGEVEK